MIIRIYPYKLEYRFPFRIAHTERTYTLSNYILLSHANHYGWGEAVFPPYLAETPATFQNVAGKILLPEDPAVIDTGAYISSLDAAHPGNRAALGAFDIALHNLQSSLTGIPVRAKYGIPDLQRPTSVTIGISSNEEIEQKIRQYGTAAYFKLKVNESEIERMVATYRKLCPKPFVVDANQGFTSVENAIKWSEKLAEFGCAYFEQPFHKTDLDSHKRLKEQSNIPVIADESFQSLSELPAISESFHGVNVKLMKSGGIAGAYHALTAAREYGLKTLIGCMSESTIGIEAAWNLAPLADWADLDGPLLIRNDLFNPALDLSKEEIIQRLTMAN